VLCWSVFVGVLAFMNGMPFALRGLLVVVVLIFAPDRLCLDYMAFARNNRAPITTDRGPAH
jgi:hypothetical protein